MTKSIPTYTQAPACGYQLSYSLTQIQTWDDKNSVYDPTRIISGFAALDALVPPTLIRFTSTSYTDDKCTYGPTDLTVCDPTKSNPYQLEVFAYLDDSIFWAPPAIKDSFLAKDNSEEKFWVHPKDPCHATTLTPAAVPTKNYFLGDGPLKYGVPRT